MLSFSVVLQVFTGKGKIFVKMETLKGFELTVIILIGFSFTLILSNELRDPLSPIVVINDGSFSAIASNANRRTPISENSTLAQALKLARQFLQRDPNLVTSHNVEFFRTSDGSEKFERQIKPKEKSKMYSWWSKKPSTTTEVTESEEASEEVTTEGKTQAMEKVTVTMTSSPNDLPAETTSAAIHEASSEDVNATPEIKITTETVSTMEDMEDSVTTKKSKKPRTKRPKSASTTPVPGAAPMTEKDTTGQDEETPNSIADPFGVKRKFISLAKSIGQTAVNQTRAFANNQVKPIVKDAARQTGILALKVAGDFGTITKNAAEDAYVNLAKRLNATELLEPKKKETTQMAPTSQGQGQMHGKGHGKGKTDNRSRNKHVSTTGSGSIDMYYDDESCSGIRESSDAMVILGTVILLVTTKLIQS